MAAVATLATLSFTSPVAAADTEVQVSSTSGLVPGTCLFAGRELLQVVRLTGINRGVKVLRGQDGTITTPHATNETVYAGRGDQFYTQNPRGVPPAGPMVTPWINVIDGTVWVVQGDQDGPGVAAQTWQQVTSAQTRGALGVRVDTVTTPA